MNKDNGTPATKNRAEQFIGVEGMHCSNCEKFIEKKARNIPGVQSAEASYATDLLRLFYDRNRFSMKALQNAFSGTGYTLITEERGQTAASESENNAVARLVLGGLFTMMAMMYYILFLYPTYFGYTGFLDLSGTEGYFILSNIFVMASFVLFYTGYPILRGAYVSLSVLSPNMDLLVALAASGAYIYSISALLLGHTDVYFDVTMTLVMVVSLGNWYENKIKKRATNRLSEITQNRIKTARRMDNDRPRLVSVHDLRAGDRVLVQPGERIPVDGHIVNGETAVDESLISGESIPVIKEERDKVVGGSVVTDNTIVVQVGENARNTLDRLVQLIWEIQASRPGAQKLADRIARFFVPLVLFLAAGTFAGGMILGLWTFSQALLISLTVLIVSCPCALGLATPLALAAGMKEALDQQIVIKNSSVFEEVEEIDHIVFDKTGTLTTGSMHIIEADVPPEVMYRARALEQYSGHPVARAIADGPLPDHYQVTGVENRLRGISGRVNGQLTYVGDPEWVESFQVKCPRKWKAVIQQSYKTGNIPVAIAWDGKVQGVLIVGDQPRKTQRRLLKNLNKDGKQLVMITGDRESATYSFKQEGLLQQIYHSVKPEDKKRYIEALKKDGRVAMIGDGSNDAPALAEADIGIAFGPTAIAADSADLVVLDSDLRQVPAAMEIARKTNRRIKQNLGWAFLYNVIAIPLAAAGLINPLFAALAMGTSSLLVVINSSRRIIE